MIKYKSKSYKFYVDKKFKASCGEKRKDEVFNNLANTYGDDKIEIETIERDIEIDENTKKLIDEIKKWRKE